MELATARQIIESLADGIDPFTGRGIESGSLLESAEVLRALQVALHAIDAQIRKQQREAELPLNAGKPWDPGDDRLLADAFDQGLTVSQIAGRMGRTEGSIASRLVRIGKAADRDSARRANRPRD